MQETIHHAGGVSLTRLNITDGMTVYRHYKAEKYSQPCRSWSSMLKPVNYLQKTLHLGRLTGFLMPPEKVL